MDELIISGTIKTPEIHFDYQSGKLVFQGRSIPEDAIAFYTPILDWIKGYINHPQSTTRIEVKLEYFNTSSSKCILDILKLLESIHENGTTITVYWYFEEDDEDMQEAGEDYQAIVHLPFKMIEVEEF